MPAMEQTLKDYLEVLKISGTTIALIETEEVTTMDNLKAVVDGCASMQELRAALKITLGAAAVIWKDQKAAANVVQVSSVVQTVLNAPSSTTTEPPAPAKDAINHEIPEGQAPSTAQVQGFASQLGVDPITMVLFMNGMMGEDMDLSGMMPFPTIVAGYNPRRRDMFYMFMGQLEKRFKCPIVVIDADGSVNKPLTTAYIEELDLGDQAVEYNIYFDKDDTAHEVVRVGVDAQSVADADPLDSSRALRQNGQGHGRINWSGTSLEFRQVVYLAVRETKEIDPKDTASLDWLRDRVNAKANKLTLQGKAPRAITLFNEKSRTGDLPTLRVMRAAPARRQEVMPRRRRTVPHEFSGIGSPRDDVENDSGTSDPPEHL